MDPLTVRGRGRDQARAVARAMWILGLWWLADWADAGGIPESGDPCTTADLPCGGPIILWGLSRHP